MLKATQWHRDLLSGEWSGASAAAAAALLSCASVPYGAGVRLRNALYDRGWLKVERVGLPVISVGNLTAGGTGKTPFVELLMRMLRNAGHRPGLLSRGYGRVASDGAAPMNDELLVLRDNLGDFPAYLGGDRVASARLAAAEGRCDCLVMDDGFQHRRLWRDLDIVMLDATAPFGGGWLLPRGLLREPLESLGRAHVAALSRVDLVTCPRVAEVADIARRFAPRSVLLTVAQCPTGFRTVSGDVLPEEHFRGKRVFAACGIGNPESFFSLLRRMGIEVAGAMQFPDHWAYDWESVRRIQERRRAAGAEAALVTQKDMVKIALLAARGAEPSLLEGFFALAIRSEIISGADDLQRLLDGLWSGRKA